MDYKLSIIVPVYKVEKFVGQCLGSILNEKNVNLPIELIVVNDGTPDNSMEIVNKFRNYHQLRIINQENQGLSMARNAGLALSRGEYVWFIDSDDWLFDGAIERVIDIISKENAPDLIAFGLIWNYEDTQKDWIDLFIKDDIVINGRNYINNNYPTGAIQRFIVRHSLLNKYYIQFYPGIYHEDGIFGIQIVYLSDSINILSSSIYHYRQREEGSIMHSLTIKSAYDMITVHQQLVVFCNNVVSEADKKWFRIRILNDLNTAIAFTYHLRKTQEFQDFIKKSKKYRQNECDICMFIGGLKVFFKCILMKYFPVVYFRITLIRNIIKNKRKSQK